MEVDGIVRGRSIYDPNRFAGVPLQDETRALLARKAESPYESRLIQLRLNRLLLEDVYPRELPTTEASLVLRNVVEVHFWAGGKSPLDRVTVPNGP
jgi:hypothetical protein